MLARLPEVVRLVETRSWFVLHAPRQCGKTTTMLALAAELRATGKYAAMVASCEAGETFRNNPDVAAGIIVADIKRNARVDLEPALRPPEMVETQSGAILADFLTAWSRACPVPVVLLLDEIDALQDEALVSVLRQLRGLYRLRPIDAPSTVALIGLRDVRDYKVVTSAGGHLGTSSPFNISVDSLTLRSFTEEEVAALYAQHTAETGQAFTAEALTAVFRLTQGQPWLVNALARQVIEKMKVTGTIEAGHIEVAKEQLILARATHLDSLAHKLTEPRVRAVIEPMLTGIPSKERVLTADMAYVTDLGLVVFPRNQERQIANPIYREVLPRELVEPVVSEMPALPVRAWAQADGRLDWPGLLAAFVDFWRQHGEWMLRGPAWPEAAHQIVLMAFLQRLVNGGGTIELEYGLGTRRLDILVRWHVRRDAFGAALEEDRHAIEVKVWRDGDADPLTEGLAQLDAYCDRLALAAGTLVIFDARSTAESVPWNTRGMLSAETSPTGRSVRLLRA